MAKVTSPGHKLGQLIGTFFEEFFSSKLAKLAEELGLYCDKKGPRPEVRGEKNEVIWIDSLDNKHKLDYVFEKNGAIDKQGEPAAFIELAWRRYTKHSRNKAGEIEAALVPLRDRYHETCKFLGAILGGEFTDGAMNQLKSKDINVLYISYSKIVEAFRIKNLDIDYSEKASEKQKASLVKAWQNLGSSDFVDINRTLSDLISFDYGKFVQSARSALLRKVDKVRIIPLFGNEEIFSSISDAIIAIGEFEMIFSGREIFHKFEVSIIFSNGSRIDGAFREREEILNFLAMYKGDIP